MQTSASRTPNGRYVELELADESVSARALLTRAEARGLRDELADALKQWPAEPAELVEAAESEGTV